MIADLSHWPLQATNPVHNACVSLPPVLLCFLHKPVFGDFPSRGQQHLISGDVDIITIGYMNQLALDHYSFLFTVQVHSAWRFFNASLGMNECVSFTSRSAAHLHTPSHNLPLLCHCWSTVPRVPVVLV